MTMQTLCLCLFFASGETAVANLSLTPQEVFIQKCKTLISLLIAVTWGASEGPECATFWLNVSHVCAKRKSKQFVCEDQDLDMS